jgi:hypothetical protein
MVISAPRPTCFAWHQPSTCSSDRKKRMFAYQDADPAATRKDVGPAANGGAQPISTVPGRKTITCASARARKVSATARSGIRSATELGRHRRAAGPDDRGVDGGSHFVQRIHELAVLS